MFKATLAKYEVKRLADAGLNPTEQQRARRTAKIFNGDNDMVILHAELDHVAGERVKTAMDALTTRMLKRDFQTGVERSFEQRNADALVQLICSHTRPARAGLVEDGSGIGRATRTGRRNVSARRAKSPAEVDKVNRTDRRNGEYNTGDTNNTRTSHAHRSQQATGHHPKHQNTSDKTNRASDSDRSNQIAEDASNTSSNYYTGCTDTGNTDTGDTNTGCEPASEPTPQATTIILTADYDAITGQLTAAGLIDGTPIGIDEIRRLGCEDNRRVDRRVARRTSYYLRQGKFGDLWCTGTLLHPQ